MLSIVRAVITCLLNFKRTEVIVARRNRTRKGTLHVFDVVERVISRPIVVQRLTKTVVL